MLRDLFSFLFPKSCPGCGQALKAGELAVCLSCTLDMPATGHAERPFDNELYYRLAGRVHLHGAAALYYFDKVGRVKQVVSSLKYRRNPAVGREMGAFIGSQVAGKEWLAGIEGVVPVPLHQRRLAERGYNQSTALAQGLAQALQLPVLGTQLRRRQHTRTQTRKGQSERWKNVSEAFELHKPLPARVLLVDDVITTGATTEACIRAMQAQGEVRVSLIALAMAR